MAMSQTSGRGGRRAVVASAVGAAALGLVLSACSSGTGGTARTTPHGTPHQIVLASVDSTEAASSAVVDVSVSVTGTPSLGGLGALGGASSSSSAGSPLNIAITGHGVYSFTDKTGDMTIDIPAIDGKPAGSFEVRRIGQDVYVKAAQLPAVDGGKPWVHVPLSQFRQGQSQSQSSNPFANLTDGDPTKILSLLQQLGAQVTQVGTAQIDGVGTTEYQGVLDLAGGTTSSTLISPQMAQALGISTVPVDVWIDGQGRARQVSTSLSVFGLTVKAQEHLGSFGTPVSVSAPPADQVADGSSLIGSGQLGSLFGGTASGSG